MQRTVRFDKGVTEVREHLYLISDSGNGRVSYETSLDRGGKIEASLGMGLTWASAGFCTLNGQRPRISCKSDLLSLE